MAEAKVEGKRRQVLKKRRVIGGLSVSSLHDDGIKGNAIRRVFLPCFMTALAANVGELVDSLLSGVFFSPMYIAAIGTVAPIHTVVSAIMQVVIHGTYATYTVTLARGQRRKSSEVFTVGLFYIVTTGFLIAMLCATFAEQLVSLTGAASPELRGIAAQYLRVTLFSYPFVGATELITLILGVYGYHKDSFAANLAGLVCNVVLSYGLYKLFPRLGFTAFGVGTMLSTIPTMLICYFAARRHRLPTRLKMRLMGLRRQRFTEMFRNGMGSALSMLAGGLIAGVINRIIVASQLGTDGLALYSVVVCFRTLAGASAVGMDYAAAPLMGMCYSVHDKRGLKYSLKTALRRGILYTIYWTLAILALSPLLVDLFLGENSAIPNAVPVVWQGIIITMLFAPLYTVIYLMGDFYENTGKMASSIIYSIVPGSALFPLMLLVLLPRLGYTGVWLSLGGNTALFLILVIVCRTIAAKSKRLSKDELLHLDKGECAQYQSFDICVRYDDEDISAVTERIQSFMRDEGAGTKTAYLIALCVDETATDITAHCREAGIEPDSRYSLIDIEIVSEEDAFVVVMTNTAPPYNPLDFEYSNDDFSKVGLMMVQRIARKIDYNYVYNMNMITIKIEK